MGYIPPYISDHYIQTVKSIGVVEKNNAGRVEKVIKKELHNDIAKKRPGLEDKAVNEYLGKGMRFDQYA